MKAQFKRNAIIMIEKKTRVVKKLEEILNSVNIKINKARFKELFKNMNIFNDDYEMIMSTVSNFLQSDMKLSADQVTVILG